MQSEKPKGDLPPNVVSVAQDTPLIAAAFEAFRALVSATISNKYQSILIARPLHQEDPTAEAAVVISDTQNTDALIALLISALRATMRNGKEGAQMLTPAEIEAFIKSRLH